MKLPKDSTTISIKFNHGRLNEDQLLKLADVMEEYQIPLLKISGGKGIVLAGVKIIDAEAVRNILDLPQSTVSKNQASVQACPGNKSCIKGLQDAEQLADQIEQMLKHVSLPSKLKVAVSGCPNCCAQSMVRDLGFIAQPEGWTITAGGMTGGVKARIADVIATGLDERQVLELTKKVIDSYVMQAKDRERIGRTIERIGIEQFKKF